jgi:outer membrane lipoprotein SlyB
MSEETPTPPTNVMRYMPSNSTAIGTLGGAGVAPIIVWALGAFTHVIVPAEIAAALGSVIGNGLGYFFEGGRRGPMRPASIASTG